MPKATSKPQTLTSPRINDQFHYINVDLGNSRRLTTSQSGVKATGAIPRNVWKVWTILFYGTGPLAQKVAKEPLLTPEQRAFLTNSTIVNDTTTVGDRVKAFVAHIGTIWPEWNKPPRSFTVGEEVKFDFGPRHGGIDVGKVHSLGRGLINVVWAKNGHMKMTADDLEEYNPLPR